VGDRFQGGLLAAGIISPPDADRRLLGPEGMSYAAGTAPFDYARDRPTGSVITFAACSVVGTSMTLAWS
jgi:hypothetical protein